MKRVPELPENYREICNVNLQKDKKTALKINLAAVAIMVLMLVPALFFVPIRYLGESLVRPLVMLGAIILYLILHEAVHAVAMELLGTKRVRFGFTGLYAYAGSDDYYGKGAYLFIALAPVVFWGIVLLVLNFLVPIEWFWVVYLVQIANVSGAAGDYYVSIRFRKMPKDILVRDTGVEMHVYSEDVENKENAGEEA